VEEPLSEEDEQDDIAAVASGTGVSRVGNRDAERDPGTGPANMAEE